MSTTTAFVARCSGDGEWRGYYLFSEEEEAALKWERAEG
jgi:hypothetical protein